MSLVRVDAVQATAAQAGFDAVIDVRSPAEFAHDHLPGALNWPVLDDEQRRIVGTLYKQVSPLQARKVGAAIVARNIAGHLERDDPNRLDISGGGLAVLVPPTETAFEPDMEFADCRLMLPEIGPIATSLRVRNLFRITNRDGSVMLRAGCEFIDLPASMASTIQRYILKTERERNARERIR